MSALLEAALQETAKAVERVLRERHPEHGWVVEVRKPDRRDGHGDTAAAVLRGKQARPGDENAGTIAHRHGHSTTDPRHEHAVDEAA